MSAAGQSGNATDWKDWGGDAARTHFSPLTQITAANVSQLKPAWVWDPGTFGRSWQSLVCFSIARWRRLIWTSP